MEFQPAKELGGLKRETAPQFSASVDLWPFVEKSQKNGKKKKKQNIISEPHKNIHEHVY